MGPWVTPEQCERARRLYAVHPAIVVCELVGITPNTLWRLKKRGFAPAGRVLRPVPNDWGLVAPGQSAEWLRKHYRARPAVISRWLALKPVERPKDGPAAQPVPSDFEQIFVALGQYQAATHYGVSSDTIRNWRIAEGIPTARQRRKQTASIPGWVERYVAARRHSNSEGSPA